MHYSSYIEISKEALETNIRFLKSLLKKNVIFSSVVKGDAYGHGIEYFVPLAEECGINHFSVFSADEAKKVLESSALSPTIIIMGMIDNNDLSWAIENDIEFFVFEKDRLLKTIETAKKAKKKASVHIELETGLNRTGFSKKGLATILQELNDPNIIIKGLCTHFAGAESIGNYYRISEQKRRFVAIYKWLSQHNIHPELKHSACSAAVIRYPDTQMDMVRVGILQYGFWPSMETFIHFIARKKDKSNPLKRVISWKSRVMSIKEVNEGEFVSYGTTYLSQKKMMIATIPVGYSHGYARSLSNHGRVLINGCMLNVVGLVNMNMLIVDASDVPNIKKDDEVVLIGKQGDLEISVASFSELSQQLNYELLIRLDQDIPRKII